MRIANNVSDELRAPSHEDWIRTTAKDLENRADGIPGIPAFAVMISPQTARFIAKALRDYAELSEETRG